MSVKLDPYDHYQRAFALTRAGQVPAFRDMIDEDGSALTGNSLAAFALGVADGKASGRPDIKTHILAAIQKMVAG